MLNAFPYEEIDPIFEPEVLEFLILEFTNFTENLLFSKWLTEKKVSHIFEIPLA